MLYELTQDNRIRVYLLKLLTLLKCVFIPYGCVYGTHVIFTIICVFTIFSEGEC